MNVFLSLDQVDGSAFQNRRPDLWQAVERACYSFDVVLPYGDVVLYDASALYELLGAGPLILILLSSVFVDVVLGCHDSAVPGEASVSLLSLPRLRRCRPALLRKQIVPSQTENREYILGFTSGLAHHEDLAIRLLVNA